MAFSENLSLSLSIDGSEAIHSIINTFLFGSLVALVIGIFNLNIDYFEIIKNQHTFQFVGFQIEAQGD
jgi:hypothetical protein